MAEEAKKEGEKTEGAPAEAPKKKSPLKLIVIVAIIMALEAVGVFFVVSSTAKKPEAAEAHEIAGEHDAAKEQSVEVPLISDKFQSVQGSQLWIWDVEIVLKVKQKYEEAVTGELERQESEIRESISTMFRKAQLMTLREPGLETINRQVTAYVTKLLGKDSEGHDRVERVLIPKCKGFPAN